MGRSSPSTPLADAPAWLDGVYAARRQRTADLARMSIDALRKGGKRISITFVVAVSRLLDLQGKGVSESALLHNPEARAYYEANRTWTSQRPRRILPIQQRPTKDAPRVKIDRNLTRARQRYLRFAKRDLVERLIAAEQACAMHEQRWLRTSDELFAWMLLVERLAPKPLLAPRIVGSGSPPW